MRGVTLDAALSVLGSAFEAALWAMAPVLAAALAVGLAVSLLQAATGMQDMTLAFVPKLAAAAAVLALAGPWMLSVLVDWMRRAFALAGSVAR